MTTQTEEVVPQRSMRVLLPEMGSGYWLDASHRYVEFETLVFGVIPSALKWKRTGWRHNLRNYLRTFWWWLVGADESSRGIWRE